jgi:hypothetical protein
MEAPDQRRKSLEIAVLRDERDTPFAAGDCDQGVVQEGRLLVQ